MCEKPLEVKQQDFIMASSASSDSSDSPMMAGKESKATMEMFFELLHKRNEDTARNLKHGTGQWMDKTSQMISVHGLAWYTRSKSKWIRAMVFIFMMFVFIGLPIWAMIQFVHFYSNLEVKTVTVAKTGSMLRYPNLTVCHAKFFDKERLQEFNISNELANYMTMVLDPNVKDFAKNMANIYPNYYAKLNDLKSDLDYILDLNKLTLVDLFHKVATKCQDFVRFCEIHRRILIPGFNTTGSCCDQVFDKTPFFTTLGTCYTTNAEIWESYPFTFSNIKVWLDVRTKQSPVYQFAYRGSDAMDRGDVYYTISNQDHPVSALLQSPNKVSKGSVTMIGLSLKETDRRSLKAKFCETAPARFIDLYNIPYTKLNCEILISQTFMGNCSLNAYYGLHLNDMRVCAPADVLALNLTYDDSKFGSGNYRNASCPYECFRRDFVSKTTSGSVDKNAMDIYINQTNFKFGNIDDVIMLQLHFNSFDYVRYVMQQESFTDFLSKIGGWFSLAFGASLISFIEIFYFMFELIFKLIEREMRKKGQTEGKSHQYIEAQKTTRDQNPS